MQCIRDGHLRVPVPLRAVTSRTRTAVMRTGRPPAPCRWRSCRCRYRAEAASGSGRCVYPAFSRTSRAMSPTWRAPQLSAGYKASAQVRFRCKQRPNPSGASNDARVLHQGSANPGRYSRGGRGHCPCSACPWRTAGRPQPHTRRTHVTRASKGRDCRQRGKNTRAACDLAARAATGRAGPGGTAVRLRTCAGGSLFLIAAILPRGTWREGARGAGRSHGAVPTTPNVAPHHPPHHAPSWSPRVQAS
jgi:hypothetical protein